MEIIASDERAMRAYLLFSAFHGGEDSMLLGRHPFGEGVSTYLELPKDVSRLDFDKAMQPLISKGVIYIAYLFECDSCGWSNYLYRPTEKRAPGQAQVCVGDHNTRENPCSETAYDEIPGISFGVKDLLEGREDAIVNMALEFKILDWPTPGREFSGGFVSQYVSFIRGRLEGDTDNPPYNMSIRAEDIKRMRDTGGLIERITFESCSLDD